MSQAPDPVPAAHRKSSRRSPELVDPIVEPSEAASEAAANFRLSSRGFKAANHCDAQTWQMVHGSPTLPASAFAKAFFHDGNAWEKLLLEPDQRALWLGRFNRLFDTAIPAEAEFINLDSHQTGGKQDSTWIAEARSALEQVREALSARPEAPLILAQVSMVPAACLSGDDPTAQLDRIGIADLVIWTGQYWYLGDIKLSQGAVLEHGAQVMLYRELWAELLASAELPTAIAPQGFVLHCSDGFPYASSLPQEERTEATELLALTPFRYEDLRDDYTRMRQTIEAQKQAQACPEPFFQKRCPECPYRQQCYATLLTSEDLSISLLPVPRSRSRALHASGIRTLGSFIDQAGSNKPPAVIEEISGNLPSLRESLIEKAEASHRRAGHSTWRFPAPWQAKVALFAMVPHEGMAWRDTNGNPLDTPPDRGVLIAYTEVERRFALAKAIEADSRPSLSFALQDDIQNSLHFPLPGWTLHEVAAWAEQMQKNDFNARFMANWTYAPDDEATRLPDPASRAAALFTLWTTLLRLQALDA